MEIGIDTYDHEDTYSYMPVLVEVEKKRDKTSKIQMIKNFCTFMEADD